MCFRLNICRQETNICIYDLTLLENTPIQAEFWLQQAVRAIDLFMNSDKTEFMPFNQDHSISSLNAKPQILVDQFIYLGSNISSTERNVNINVGKAWTTIHWLMTDRFD